ncbi:MAG: EsaB/YukD family protein [Saprospiraceae bacterium]
MGKFKVTIRLTVEQKEFNIALSTNATPDRIVQKLINANLIDKISPSGEPYVYEIQPKGKNLAIEGDESLEQAGVTDGDILLLIREVIAG